MNIKLHNKFEIIHNNQTLTAYNTLLNTVYQKIAELGQYTSHMAFGLGQQEVEPDQSKLGQYALTLKCTTEEVQCDPTMETLYIKKSVVIPESSPTEFSFCEIGLTDTEDFDPTIYNHVLLKDNAGQVVTLTRKQGEALEIKVTIYLELSTTGKGLFVKGQNNLIRQILGDDLQIEDKNLYACRGENLVGNEYTSRSLPDMSKAVICDKKATVTENGLDISYTADMGVGLTEELVLVYGNAAVLRINTMETKPPKNTTATLTSLAGNVLELGENVKEVTSASCGEEVDSGYTVTRYASKLTDKVTDLFDQPFTSSTMRYQSKDGSMIAFIYQSKVHLYRSNGYTFEKLNTTQMPASDIMKMFLFKDKILMLMTSSPYFRMFDIEQNNVIIRGVDFNYYQASVYPYSWLDADATECDSGKILLGLIVNNEEHTPVILRISKNPSGTYLDSIEKPKSVGAEKVFALGKTPFNEPFVSFLTANYLGQKIYAFEEFFETTSEIGDSDKAFALLDNSSELLTGGRAVMSQYSISPFLKVFYFPDLIESPEDLTTGVKHYVSGDGNYIIAKSQEGKYTLYNFHNVNKLEPFIVPLENSIASEEVKDFAFTPNYLLVFTLSSVYGLVYKMSMTRLDNVKSSEAEYTVSMKTYDLLGAKDLEGVRIELKLSFKDNTAASQISSMQMTKFSSTDDEQIGG